MPMQDESCAPARTGNSRSQSANNSGNPSGNARGAEMQPYPDLSVFRLARRVKGDRVETLQDRERPRFQAVLCKKGCALSSVEEHFLHTEGVAGSSPAARTIFSNLKPCTEA